MECLSSRTECLGCHLIYPILKLDEELKDEGCKGTYLTVHSGATLSDELARWSPVSTAVTEEEPPRCPEDQCTRPHLPAQVFTSHFWHHCVILQGGTRLFYFVVASVEASCGNVPVEAILSGHKAALETSRSGKRIAGIMQWWGLNFLSGCDFGKELHCLSCFQELVTLCQRSGYSCWINGFNW